MILNDHPKPQKIYYKFILIFLIACIAQKADAQMYVKDILNDKIPVSYKGKPIDAYEYKDGAGLHIYLVTKTKQDRPVQKVTITGACYTQTNGTFVKDWSITDFAFNILLYNINTKIVDIDNDGIYETVFVYQLNPDAAPGADWKMMMHYKNQKYVVRAHVAGFTMNNGSLERDKGFDTLPAAIKNYAIDYWNDIADRNELGLSFSK